MPNTSGKERIYTITGYTRNSSDAHPREVREWDPVCERLAASGLMSETRRRLLGLPPRPESTAGVSVEEEAKGLEGAREIEEAWEWLGTRLGSEQQHLTAAL